jgi:hypothetical protein
MGGVTRIERFVILFFALMSGSALPVLPVLTLALPSTERSKEMLALAAIRGFGSGETSTQTRGVLRWHLG